MPCSRSRRLSEASGSVLALSRSIFSPSTGFSLRHSSWTRGITEYDGKDTLFGLVDGHEKELGYFSLSEIQSVRGPLGLPVERDLHWKPAKLREIAPEMFEDAGQKEA